MTMNSSTGCIAIQTDAYWFFLADLKYVFACVGLLGGLITSMLGRLLLKYVNFASVIGAMIAITDAVLFLIYDGMDLDSFAYWLAFVISGICGLLLAWLSTKNLTGGSLVVAGWTGFELGVALSNLLYFQV